MVTYNYISSKDPLVFHIFPCAMNICSQSTNVGASLTSDIRIEPSSIQSLSHENVLNEITKPINPKPLNPGLIAIIT